MDVVKAFPTLGFRSFGQDLGQLRLTSKSQQLRDKLKLLRLSNMAPQEAMHQIECHLNAISQDSSAIKQWGQYELAYEEYISVALPEDLLGIILGLRSSSDVLDVPNQAVWSTRKLEQLEQEVRQGNGNATVREEIASLARAVYDSGLHRMRHAALKWKLVRVVLSLSTFFSILVTALLVVFQMKEVPANSALQILLVGCLGACGALLSASIRLRQLRLTCAGLQDEAAGMFFRAAVGAVAAVIITLFLRLRVVDFPYLHTGPADTAPLAPAALYIFAFVSGASEKFFFRSPEKALRRGAEPLWKHFAQKGELTLPQIVASVGGRD
jgi:hypothetical protein